MTAVDVGVRADMPMLWVNADRALYRGLLGNPMDRNFGGYSIYLSPRGWHRISVAGGAWNEGTVSVVPPFVTHRICSGERTICGALLETETLDSAVLPGWLRGQHGVIDGVSLTTCFDRMFADSVKQAISTRQFDQGIFGLPLESARLEHRIQAVVERIKANPNGALSAGECAADACLSESRFLHLFSQQLGVPFRRFKAWKRARTLLYHVNRKARLTDVALDAGYPDSTHFSHSIRATYGLTPKSIFAGSRRLAVHVHAGSS